MENWKSKHTGAGAYEDLLVPVLFEPWARALVEAAGLKAGSRVLDVACGTGVVTRAAARAVGPAGSIVGLDLNAEMLDVARKRTFGAGQITWQQGSADDTGLPDGDFDAVFCQQGLQFFPDRPAALGEFRRVLKPGGRLALSTWRGASHPAYLPIVEAFDRHAEGFAAVRNFVAAIFALEDGEVVRRLLAEAGFSSIELTVRDDTVRYGSAEAWLEAFVVAAPVPAIRDLPAEVVQRVRADAIAGLRALEGREGFAFTIGANVALATA